MAIEGRTVLVVEDILDTGLTLKFLMKLFEERKPKHLRIAVLLDKLSAGSQRERRLCGFHYSQQFVSATGSYDERYRNAGCLFCSWVRGKSKAI